MLAVSIACSGKEHRPVEFSTCRVMRCDPDSNPHDTEQAVCACHGEKPQGSINVLVGKGVFEVTLVVGLVLVVLVRSLGKGMLEEAVVVGLVVGLVLAVLEGFALQSPE